MAMRGSTLSKTFVLSQVVNLVSKAVMPDQTMMMMTTMLKIPVYIGSR
jgi:hypothetical protein